MKSNISSGIDMAIDILKLTNPSVLTNYIGLG